MRVGSRSRRGTGARRFSAMFDVVSLEKPCLESGATRMGALPACLPDVRAVRVGEALPAFGPQCPRRRQRSARSFMRRHYPGYETDETEPSRRPPTTPARPGRQERRADRRRLRPPSASSSTVGRRSRTAMSRFAKPCGGQCDGMKWLLRAAPALAVTAVAAHDLVQRRHALLRNFPLIGHARYFIEAVGPELRQYVVAGNDEERPFSRDQRRWVYASSKLENNYFGFGTDNDVEHTLSYPIVKHATFAQVAPPSSPSAGQEAWVPCAKVVGAARGRAGCVSSGLGRELLGDELRLAVGPGRRGAQPRCRIGRLHAEHRGRRLVTASPPRRRPRVPDRHRLLRLPRRARAVRPRPPEGRRGVRAGAGPRGEAVPRRQTGPRRVAARRQDLARDRRSPRHPDGSTTASVRHGTPSSPTPTACWTGSSCSPPRPGCRSASSPPSATWRSGTTWPT